MKVVVVGATGETGGPIINGLLAAGSKYEITALTRPASIEKPEIKALTSRGVKVVPADLNGPQDALVSILQGIDVVISALNFTVLSQEYPLATAAKAAGVKRYVPCFFGTPAPRGVMTVLRDQKEDILDHVKRLYLPYTAIDVGWWYQIILPKIPSGRFDNTILFPINTVFNGGNVPIALTDKRDIGVYVEKIISDPRTLNKMVFAYTEVLTQNQVFDAVEKVTGETVEKTESTGAEIESKVEEMRKAKDPHLAVHEYHLSWGVRGDNSPEKAKYLGYVLAEDLYPDVKGRGFDDFLQDVLDGEVGKPYGGRQPLDD